MSLLMDALKRAEEAKQEAGESQPVEPPGGTPAEEPALAAMEPVTLEEALPEPLAEEEAPLPDETETPASASIPASEEVLSETVEPPEKSVVEEIELFLEEEREAAEDERAPEKRGPEQEETDKKREIPPEPPPAPSVPSPEAAVATLAKAKSNRKRGRRVYGLAVAAGAVVVLLGGGYYYLESALTGGGIRYPPPVLPVSPPAGQAGVAVSAAAEAEPPAEPEPASPSVAEKGAEARPEERPASTDPVVLTPAPPPAEPKTVAEPARPIPEKKAVRITRSRTGDSSQQQLNGAYRAYGRGDLEEAQRGYRKVLDARPDSRDALLGLAAIAQRRGELPRARGYYRHLLKLNPKESLAVSGLISLSDRARPLENESRIKLLLDREPESAHLHFALGVQYLSQARWGEAQQAFFQAYRYAPDNPDYIYNLAVSLDRLGKREAALGYYRQALEAHAGGTARFDAAAVRGRIQTLAERSSAP